MHARRKRSTPFCQHECLKTQPTHLMWALFLAQEIILRENFGREGADLIQQLASDVGLYSKVWAPRAPPPVPSARFALCRSPRRWSVCNSFGAVSKALTRCGRVLLVQSYGKGRGTVLAVSSVPLPNYRADLDSKLQVPQSLSTPASVFWGSPI